MTINIQNEVALCTAADGEPLMETFATSLCAVHLPVERR